MSRSIKDDTRVSMHRIPLEFGTTIFSMACVQEDFTDWEAMRLRLHRDGYLLLRGFFDRKDILSARHEILHYMAEMDLLRTGAPVERGCLGDENRSFNFRHQVIQSHFSAYLNVVNSSRIMSFFEGFLGGPVLSLDHKWLRAVGRGQHTNAHFDAVYMGKGTHNLYTAWIPFGDISLDMGPLAVCLGSHQLNQLKTTYGMADAHENLESGWFSNDPLDVVETLGIRWASTNFEMGDLVVFGMHFMHASLDNVSDRYRLSSDTRYQLTTDPVDTRHMGKAPDVIPKSNQRISLEQARKNWGLERPSDKTR